MELSIETTLSHAFHSALKAASRGFGGSFGRLPSEPPRPPVESRLHTSSLTFHLLTWPGTGDPVVLLHGINSNAWVWARVAPLLRTHRPIIAITLPGHGFTDPSTQGYSLHTTARQVLDAIHRVAPDQLSLAGHSYGGKLAIVLAQLLGQRLQSLCLLDPVPPQGLNLVAQRFPTLTRSIFAPERGHFPDRASMEQGLRTLLYLSRWGDIEQLVADQSFRQQPDGSWLHCLPQKDFESILFGALCEDVTPMLKSIQCAVRLIRPTLSVAFLPGETNQLRHLVPHMQVRHVPGDHDFILTNPIDTARAMRKLVRG